ncbi:MAG: thioredoxin family protein [Planctomycetota bacterium]
MGNLNKGYRAVTASPPRRATRLAAVFALLLGVVATTPATAQFDNLGGDLLGGDQFGGGFNAFGDPDGDPVTVTAQFTAATAERPAVLMVTAEIAPRWHVYSMTQPAGGPLRTEIKLTPSDQYRVAGSFAAYPEHESHIDQLAWVGLEIQEHAEQVTWYLPIELSEGVDPATIAIAGVVEGQACLKSCVPLNLPFTAKLGSGVEIGPLNLQSPAPPTEPTTPSNGAPSSDSAAPAGEPYDLSAIQFAATEQEGSLLWYLLIAFGGGLILNLMPCVLPVIGLKVMSFADQAGKSRSHAFALNLWYSLGIFSVFMVLAVLAILAGLSWGEQFGSPTFNVIMASIIFVMALSLLGVWEIPIPGFLGSGKAQEAAQKEGAIGAFLKGVVTTLLATPCIGPGMGAALGWAVKQPPSATLAVFAALGVGMASPYLVIGRYPSLVRFLPKPGAWMETFKQLMGFVLLGTVLFLLAILPTHDLLPTLSLFVGLALACWVYAKTPLTASLSERQQTWALSGAISVGAAVFAFGWLAPTLTSPSNESWRPFSLASLNQSAVEDGKTVLVDFSADWCTNCKVLEKTVLHTTPVEEAIRQKGVVTMYADYTDTPPEIKETLKALQASGVPVIAVFPGGDPYRPIVFRDGYTQRGLIKAIEQAKLARAASRPPVAEVASLPQP